MNSLVDCRIHCRLHEKSVLTRALSCQSVSGLPTWDRFDCGDMLQIGHLNPSVQISSSHQQHRENPALSTRLAGHHRPREAAGAATDDSGVSRREPPADPPRCCLSASGARGAESRGAARDIAGGVSALAARRTAGADQGGREARRPGRAEAAQCACVTDMPAAVVRQGCASNSRRTAAMSASVGKPASLPRCWIL
jgi:hypothetical protein